MTDAQPPGAAASTGATPPPTRVGSAERQQAMDALDVHLSAGRLDPEEYGERFGRASVARTTADLEPLFLDLPLPHAGGTTGVASSGTGRPATPSPSSAPGWGAPPSPPATPARQRYNGREPLGGRLGEVAVAASPFIALILFFLVDSWDHSWLFFLLIPLTGIIVYGRDWHDRDHRHRDRDRRRNR